MLGRPRLDISNKRFGWLVAIRSRVRPFRPYGGMEKRTTFWLCRCDCGKMKVVPTDYLTSGQTKSCRCLRPDSYGENNSNYRHGQIVNHKKSLTYNSYGNMLARCLRPTHPNYDRYGGRGIQVCDRWRKDFLNFLLDMGEKTIGTDLHRKNNNGNYNKKNCEWIDKSLHGSLHAKEQRSN